MIATLRTTFAWVFLGLMALSLTGCSDKSRRDAAPVITQQPGSLSVSEGSPASFTVAASPPTATIQWYRSGVPISGATTATYTIAAVTAADNGARFYAIATTRGGNATSADAILTVRAAPPVIGTQPANVTVNAGATATFTVAATGSGLTYQWQKDGTNIPGATTASYTTPATVAGDSGAQFRVVVTNTGGSVTSSAATLTVIVPPTITTQPANASVNVGATATFSVVATGTGVTYQWQRGTTNITGATAASYTTPATVIGDDGATFRVVVTNAAGSVTSSAATLTVVNPTPPSTFRTTPIIVGTNDTAVALKADGTVWAWGRNAFGEAGQGNTTALSTPAQVQTATGPLTRITKIAAGPNHVLALDDTGNVWVWGTATALGSRPNAGTSNTTVTRAERVLVSAGGAPVANVVDVAAGGAVSGVAFADGTIATWGNNQNGATGIAGASTGIIAFPTAVTGISGVVEISGGDERMYARTADGRVFAWGFGSGGALGNGGTANATTPVQVSGVTTAVRIEGGRDEALAILSDGEARLWGTTEFPGTSTLSAANCTVKTQSTPVAVAKPSAAASTFSVAAPLLFTELYVFGGTLYETGDLVSDGAPGLCNGTLVPVAGLANVVGVARTWGQYTHAWTTDGTVYGVGDNAFGQLGLGNTTAGTGPRVLTGFNLLGSTSAGTQVFFTDFESGLVSQVAAGGGASITGVQQFAGLGATGNQFGGSFLRSATGNVVTVTLTNLPAHSAISLQFLFAAIDSLDGAGVFPAGDYFRITMDGTTIFREAFANATPTQVQTYLAPPGVELARRVDLGFTGPGSFYTDSAYDLGQDPQFVRIPHTASSVTFTFQIEGAGIQPLDDESWAMDNLKISIVP